MNNKADVNITSKGLLRINKLREINEKNHSWGKAHTNKRIYRILYYQDVYRCAYEKLKSNKGAMTPGSDPSTLDGISLKRIDRLIEDIKTEKWQPRPARRILILKNKGKQRPKGIQCPEETIIQEIIRMILESIYEPHFLNYSHGFRKDKSCLTAMDMIRKNFDGVSYIIEGDIKKCYDSFNHQVLISLIQKRVKDQKFINLLQKLLKAGYLTDIGKKQEVLNIPSLGIPQESVLSPLLVNIYLHEFDLFVVRWINQHSSPRKNQRNPKALPLNRAIKIMNKAVEPKLAHTFKQKGLIQQIKMIKRKLTQIPYVKSGLKAYYVRYADDWIIGINGPASTAKNLKTEASKFLKEKLDLQLNLEKTKVTDLTNGDKVMFLGYQLKKQTRGKIMKMKPLNKSPYYKGTTGHKIQLGIPHKKIVRRLYEKGFCDENGFPLAYKKWTPFDDHLIVASFNTVRRGLINYYCLADNSNIFYRIDYILRYSLAKTLAHRHRSSIKKIFKKHGKTLKVEYTNSKGKVKKTSMPKFENFKPNIISTPKMYPFDTHMGRVTKSKLGSNCCICGENHNVEMHHVKHIRKRKNTKNKQTFTTFMGLINRKQIPVCRACHTKIHTGKYNSIKLNELFDPKLA
jgi:group II intron reverse transcriptase/maturase